MLDPAVCAERDLGAPWVTKSALARLHQLLIEYVVRRSSSKEAEVLPLQTLAAEILLIVGLTLAVAVILGILIMARLGRWNIAYMVFVSLIGALILLVDWFGISTDDAQAMGVAMTWFWVPLAFFIVNAGSAIWRIFTSRSPKKQLIGCALPPLSLVIPLALTNVIRWVMP